MSPTIIFKLVPGNAGHLVLLDETAGKIISGAEELRNEREALKFLEEYAQEKGLKLRTIRTGDGRVDRVEGRPSVTISLTLSPEADEMLDGLSRDLGMSRGEAIAKAIVLLNVASRARQDGKAFGIATSPDSLETEIVGIGAGQP